MRKGSANTGRGEQRFVREIIGRVRSAGATETLIFRMDAGFWSWKAIAASEDHDAQFSTTVTRQPVITTAIDQIPDDGWVDVAYTDGGTAQVAETTWDRWRLIVRPTRMDNDPNLPTLFAGCRHHAFVTNRTGDAVALDADPRAHAAIGLSIRDLKHGIRLNHCPSGAFNANNAWLPAPTLTHNLIRWTRVLGAPDAPRPANAKTFRRRLLTTSGRLTRTTRRWTLHLPAHWPWQHVFEDTLGRLRALPAPM